jgi:hypothetical protein
MLKYMPKVRLLFTLRNPVVRAYSEYLNKREDKTVMRYLHKRFDNKMDKELSPHAPPFAKLVEDVAHTIASCGAPNRTYSMPDEYDEEMEKERCYVNPFVGAGRYARYLSNWVEAVPREQLLLLNFDAWTVDAEASMRRVFSFLSLSRFDISIEQAHNTHLARSVHVSQHGASNLSEIAANSVSDELSLRTHCILHEFYRPFQADLDVLLTANGYGPMRWDTARKGTRICPESSRHSWPSRFLLNSARGNAGDLREDRGASVHAPREDSSEDVIGHAEDNTGVAEHGADAGVGGQENDAQAEGPPQRRQRGTSGRGFRRGAKPKGAKARPKYRTRPVRGSRAG